MQHHKRRKFLVGRTQTIRQPCAETGPPGLLMPRLHECDCRVVVDGFGVDRTDHAHLVDHLGGPRQEFTDLTSTCSSALELKQTRRGRKTGLPAGHGGQPLPHSDGLGQLLIKPVGQAWFGIPHVDLARGTTHEEVNHPFGFGGEMPIGESSGWTGQAVLGQQAGQRRRAHASRYTTNRAREELTPGQVAF